MNEKKHLTVLVFLIIGFSGMANAQPVINSFNVSPAPDAWTLKTDIDAEANVTDVDGNLNTVYAEVYGKDVLIQNKTLTQSGDIWTVSDLWNPAQYDVNYTISLKAVDTNGTMTSNNITGSVKYPSKLNIDTVFNNTDLSIGETYKDFYSYNLKRVDVAWERYEIIDIYNVTTDGTTNTYRYPTANRSLTVVNVGQWNNGTIDIIFENGDSINDTTWNTMIRDMESSDNIKITSELNLYSSNNKLKTTYSNNISMNYAESTEGVVERALQWFGDNVLSPIIDTVLNAVDGVKDVVNDVLNAIISLIVGIAELIVYLITLLLQVILDIVMYIVNGIVNSLQFVLFYHTSFDYQENNTTYDRLNETDMGVIDLVDGNLNVITGDTQTENFDSSFGLVGKTMLTYSDSLELYTFEFNELEGFFSQVDVNTSEYNLTLNYDRYELIGKYSGTEYEQAQGSGATHPYKNVVYANIVDTGEDNQYIDRVDVSNNGLTGNEIDTVSNEGHHGIASGGELLVGSHNQDFGYLRFKGYNMTNNGNIFSVQPAGQSWDTFNDKVVSHKGNYIALYSGLSGEYELWGDSGTRLASISQDVPNILSYDFSSNENTLYIANGTHIVEWSTQTTDVEDINRVKNALDVSTSKINNYVGVARGENGFTVYSGDNFIANAENTGENVQAVDLSPTGERVIFKNNLSDVKAYKTSENAVKATIANMDASDIIVSQNGQLLVLSNDGVTGFNNYRIYYMAGENPYLEQSKVSLTVDYPKAFDEKGLPFGTVTLLSILIGLIGLIASVVPEPIKQAISVFFNAGVTILLLAVDIVVTVTQGIDWALTTGAEYVKWGIYGYVGIKAMKYFKMLQDDHITLTQVANEFTRDLEQTFDRIVTLTDRSYRILDMAFHNLIEILKTVKQYIPFI